MAVVDIIDHRLPKNFSENLHVDQVAGPGINLALDRHLEHVVVAVAVRIVALAVNILIPDIRLGGVVEPMRRFEEDLDRNCRRHDSPSQRASTMPVVFHPMGYDAFMTKTEGAAFDPEIVKRLRGARRVVVLTGAGISAESGVPTFRDAQTGLWARYNPEELATPQAFRHDPGLVWKWYLWRRELVTGALPNPGHRALVRLEQVVDDLVIVTQNVDGLHRRAGSRRVIELHGDITRTVCSACRKVYGDPVMLDDGIPRCAVCDEMVRPDVVWFGEALPVEALQTAVAACRGCDLCIAVGTSALVQPAASLPFEALTSGAPVIEVNPQVTPFTPRATYSIRGRAGEVLPHLVEAAWSE